MVDIEEIQENRPTIIASSFNPEEQQELNRRHIRSTAGVLACKQAVCSLLYQVTGHSFENRELTISWLPSGKPFLQSFPEHLSSSIDIQNLFLSISHTGEKAYGLAVYQEPGNEK